MKEGNNTIGRDCVCCKKFYPISWVNEKYGTRYEQVENGTKLCDECFEVLMEMIRKEKEKRLVYNPKKKKLKERKI